MILLGFWIPFLSCSVLEKSGKFYLKRNLPQRRLAVYLTFETSFETEENLIFCSFWVMVLLYVTLTKKGKILLLITLCRENITSTHGLQLFVFWFLYSKSRGKIQLCFNLFTVRTYIVIHRRCIFYILSICMIFIIYLPTYSICNLQ